MAKQWRFFLRSEFRGEVELAYEPENWRDRETKLIRDMRSYGISREISSPFSFIKDGYAYVKDVFNKRGYNALVYVDVFELDPVTRKYVSYFSGELIMKTCEIEDTKAIVQATPTGIQKLLKDRANKDVLIDTTWSFDYGYIQFDLPQVFVKTHSRLIKRTLSGIWTESRTYPLSAGELLQIGFDDFAIDELPGVIKERATIDTIEVFPILKAEEEGDYTFDVAFLIRVSTNVGDELQFYYKINKNGTPVSVSTVFSTVTDSGGTFYIFTVTCSDVIELKKGDSLYFWAVAGRATTARLFVGGVTNRPVGAIADKWILTGETTIGDLFPNGVLVFEACEKALKNMLGDTTQLYSNALGRTDLGYAVDAKPGMNWIGTGAGLAFKPGQIKTSFKKLFTDGLAPLYNLGIDLDKASDGSPRVIIEELSYFFSGKVGYTITGVTGLRKRVADTLIYDELMVGFTKYESSLPGSAEDPHTEANYLIPGRFVDNTLDIRSGLIASSWKIEEKRRDFGKATTRVENDQDLYIINILRNLGAYESIQDQNYEEVTGVENADTLYNLDLIPSRVIRRWGPNIASCYYRGNDLVRYASSESESNLSTRQEGEDFPVPERRDIGSTELEEAIWLPELYEFTAKLKATEDRELIARKYDIIEVIEGDGSRHYGYLLERGRTEKNEASFTLLRANYNG